MAVHLPARLVLPLQQVEEHLIEIAADRIVLADPQIVQFLCEASRRNLVPLPDLHQRGGGLRPGVKVVVV